MHAVIVAQARPLKEQLVLAAVFAVLGRKLRYIGKKEWFSWDP